MGNKFLSTILVETSKKDLDQYAARKVAFVDELQKAIDVSFPGLASVEIREGLSMVCSGLSEEQAKAIYVFLQWASCKDFLEGRSSKYFGFARSKTGTTKAALLHKRGFPEGDFQWMYGGVTDYGPASTQRCSLSGHLIRYGHLFIARGTSNVNVPALTLSSGSAAALFGMDKTVFDDVIRGQSRALRDIAGAVLARRFGKGTDYLDFLCGAAGSFLLLEGLDSVGDLMPFVVDETLFSDDACTSSEGSMIACKTPQGVVNRSYGWVREHIYSCLNANLDSAFTRLIPENLPASCAEDMRAMVNPLTYAHELISVGLLPTEGLCVVINKGLLAGIMCHRVPAAEDTDIEDVGDNWKYSIRGDTLVLQKYIGMNPDLVVRNTYMVEGKKFTKVVLAPTTVTREANGAVSAIKGGVFTKNTVLKTLRFEKGIALPKNCQYLFFRCSVLKSLDLSELDTSKVTSTCCMFRGCHALATLNLGHFVTSNVTSMLGMFMQCRSLMSLDLSSFDTAQVVDMRWMFNQCISLGELDLRHFNIAAETSVDGVFDDSVIGTLYFWGTRADWDALKSWEKSIGTLICKEGVSPEVIEDVTANWEYSINGDVLTLEKYIGASPAVVVRNTYMAEGKKFTKVALMETKVTLDSDGSLRSVDAGVFAENTGLKSIVFEEGILLPEKCWYMFYDCCSLEYLDLSHFDTSKVTNMKYMFGGCNSLESLDLSSFDTSKVTDMQCMFLSCISLDSLDLSYFDTSRVTAMQYMFTSCRSLKSLDLSNFDTSRVTTTRSMFYGCSSLESLDLSHFDTSKVTLMGWMFAYCESLKSLDLSSFDTSRVTDMGTMFHGCRSLKSLDLSHFGTSKVTNMRWMFYDCSSLESLNLSNFDTSRVTDMRSMFRDCCSLEALDLSSFDTSRVTDMESMFYGCSSLDSLDLSHFDTSSVTDMYAMFIASAFGTLYFWGTRSAWAALESKPDSVGTLICKDDLPSRRVSALTQSLSFLVQASTSGKGRVLCAIRLTELDDLDLSSLPVYEGKVSGNSDIVAYVDESDPTLLYFWVPVDMVPMVARSFRSLGFVDCVSDSAGHVLRSYGSGVSASEIDPVELEMKLDLGMGDYESESYKRLYALVEDAYSFYTCDVNVLRQLPEYAGKTELVIRRSQMKEVKVLRSAVECALYARELRYPLPVGVRLSPEGLAVLERYEATKQFDRVVLKALRTECYNAGLIFTASGLLKGVLELLLEDDIRALLRDASEEMLVNSLVQLLSNYQLMRSGVLTVLVGLYRMVEARGAGGLTSRIAKLHSLVKAGSIPSKKLSVQAVLDAAGGN